MSNYVNESLLDASPIRKQKEEAAKLVVKWEKSGLLEGMENEWQRSGMATLLENQARQLISEASTTNPGGAGDEEWSGVALPLVRRVFGNIVAQELVSVQPMNLPSGLVFYLDFKYGTALSGRSSGDSIHGKTGPNNPSGSSAPYGEGGFYGAGRYGYSDGSASIQAVTFGGTATAGAAATLADVNFDSEYSASKAGTLFKMTGSLDGIASLDLDAIRAYQFTKSSVVVDPRFVSVVKGTGVVTIIAEAAAHGTCLLYTSPSPRDS